MNNSTVPFVSDYKNHILISRYISLYSYPVIMIVGTIANILTVLVMTRNRMRNHSTYFYLRTLAVADQMVLIFGCFRSLVVFYSRTSLRGLSEISCKLIPMSLHSSMHFSAWLIVLMTVERCIVVAYPLKAKTLCTNKQAKINTAILALIILAINCHYIFGLTILNDRCMPSTDLYMTFANYWLTVHGIVYAFIPLSLIIIFNTFIMQYMSKATKQIEEIGLSTNSHQSVNNNRRLNIILVLISTTFCLTTTPLYTYFMLVTLGLIQITPDYAQRYYILELKSSFEVLMYLNHAINFFLYALMGGTFRHELTRLMCRRERQKTRITEGTFFGSNRRSTAITVRGDVELKNLNNATNGS